MMATTRHQSNQIRTAKSVLSAIGSVAATAVVARSVINDFIPREIRHSLFSTFHSIVASKLSSEIVMVIEEFDGLNINHIFEAAELLEPVQKPPHLHLHHDFEGTKFRWTLHCVQVNNNHFNARDKNSVMRSEVRSFHLTYNKFKNVVLEKYFPHIIKEAEFLKQQTKPIKLFTVEPNNIYGNPANIWNSIPLNHPAMFDTLAMESELKKMIIEDLERLVSRREYYRRVGKAWKRDYLLYGPPGTGKSSLIAAMANYLKFDVYVLDFSGFRGDMDFRKALLGTANKSIVVVEDIDCLTGSLDRTNENHVGVGSSGRNRSQQLKVTLSGLLNFIDGLWSTCGDERIIVFTTNHKNKLDPHCYIQEEWTPYSHVVLHSLLIEETQVTPAEVADQLMRHNELDLALRGLVEFLELKKVQIAKAKAKKLEDESKS
ncbi:Protein HYPER-SENSITIVITY-RELATED 4 [Bienertia sinuspersici]